MNPSVGVPIPANQSQGRIEPERDEMSLGGASVLLGSINDHDLELGNLAHVHGGLPHIPDTGSQSRLINNEAGSQSLLVGNETTSRPSQLSRHEELRLNRGTVDPHCNVIIRVDNIYSIVP